MKRFLSLILCCILLIVSLTGCSGNGGAPSATPTPQAVNFVPETTAVATGGLAQALASVGGSYNGIGDEADEEAEIAEKSVESVENVNLDDSEDNGGSSIAEVTEVPATAEPQVSTTLSAPAQPLATATPQPNTAISSYTEIGGAGLGFRFSYPSGWQNVPGRSTVCYLQPVTEGTLYPARVSVSMKQLPHKCNMTLLEEQMVSLMRTIMSQYDEKTFQVDEKLDTDTKFMGNNKTLATSYLAYDGDQEIEGYVIMTYFERYVFAYHFVCAYEDYETFGPAMRRMRDSVQADQNEMVHEDD